MFGCGWLWFGLVGCGWLWLVVVGCGWLWLVVVGVFVGVGWFWLVWVGVGWLVACLLAFLLACLLACMLACFLACLYIACLLVCFGGHPVGGLELRDKLKSNQPIWRPRKRHEKVQQSYNKNPIASNDANWPDMLTKKGAQAANTSSVLFCGGEAVWHGIGWLDKSTDCAIWHFWPGPKKAKHTQFGLLQIAVMQNQRRPKGCSELKPTLPLHTLSIKLPRLYPLLDTGFFYYSMFSVVAYKSQLLWGSEDGVVQSPHLGPRPSSPGRSAPTLAQLFP